MPAPRPTRLFHITAIANLPAIFAKGALLSKNGGAGLNGWRESGRTLAHTLTSAVEVDGLLSLLLLPH
jgi:hypothetical protein